MQPFIFCWSRRYTGSDYIIVTTAKYLLDNNIHINIVFELPPTGCFSGVQIPIVSPKSQGLLQLAYKQPYPQQAPAVYIYCLLMQAATWRSSSISLH